MGSFSNGPNQNIPMTTAMVPAIIAVHAPVPVARFHNSPPRIGTNKPPTRKSYSKIFSPGARVSWIAAPQPVREQLQVACESVRITPSVLAQELFIPCATAAGVKWKDPSIPSEAVFKERMMGGEVEPWIPASIMTWEAASVSIGEMNTDEGREFWTRCPASPPYEYLHP